MRALVKPELPDHVGPHVGRGVEDAQEVGPGWKHRGRGRRVLLRPLPDEVLRDSHPHLLRAPRIPPRPDVQTPERRAGWRARLRSIPTPWGWQRDWPRMERLDLVKIEGTKTVIYPSPEAKQRSSSAIAALALL